MKRFLEREVKKKTLLLRLDFFLSSSPPRLSRIVVASVPRTRDAYAPLRSGLVLTASGFHRFCATKSVRSESHKQHGCQVPTMVLLGTRSP